MLLAEVADGNNNTGCNKLAQQCIYIQQLYKQFKQKIIEYEIESK